MWLFARLLTPQAELGDDLPVALDVVVADVVEQPAPAADELHQTSAGVAVAPVRPPVLGEGGDALAQECELGLGRARVRVAPTGGGNRFGLFRHTPASLCSSP